MLIIGIALITLGLFGTVIDYPTLILGLPLGFIVLLSLFILKLYLITKGKEKWGVF